MKHSTLRIYLDWLDTVRELLARYAGETVESWQSLPAVPDLADELRAIADAVVEIAQELRDIADAIEHLNSKTESVLGGISV